ncbi:hypothetical protein TNCV_4398441 [Trichonephila clavipes]|nr:hypothetical protein TNCV_4398441 [Trichonephila clavipes]
MILVITNKKGNGTECNNDLLKGLPAKTSSILKDVHFDGDEHFSRLTENIAQEAKRSYAPENLHILALGVKGICVLIKNLTVFIVFFTKMAKK